MTDSNRQRRPEVNRMQREELLRDRRIKTRMFTLNVLTFAFFMATFIYLGILLAGVLRPEDESAGQPMWWALVLVSVLTLPCIAIVVSQMLRGVTRARTVDKVFGKAMPTMIVALCGGESVALFGVATPFLHAPIYVGVGLIVASWVVMTGFVLWVRPKIVKSLLIAVLEEAKTD